MIAFHRDFAYTIAMRWDVYDRYGNQIYLTKGKAMIGEWYEYDEEGDVLDVYFGERRAAWTIELTPNIMISIDRTTQQVVNLTLLDYTELSRRTAWGPRSFPLTGLAGLPFAERDLVLQILNTAPVNRWLDLSSVQTLPDSPFAVTHLEPPPPAVAALIPALA